MTREELEAFLGRFPYLPVSYWGGKGINKLIREVNDGEALLTHLDPEYTWRGVDGFVRVIHTVLIRTFADLPQEDGSTRRMQLVELKREKNGEWLPRRNRDETHLSEKIRWLLNPPETREEAVWRLFCEELDLRHKETGEQISFDEVLATLRFDHAESIPEMTGSDRLFGSITRNFTNRGECVIDPAYYRPEYREHDNNSVVTGVFRWRGIEHDSEPIPVLYG